MRILRTADRDPAFCACQCASDTERYNELFARQTKKERKLAGLTGEKDAKERVARSKVGLWSDYGIAAVRDKFWYMVNEGTGFAKRSTWWDAFFLMLSGRGDEGVAGFFMRLLMNFCFNFTIGMIGALVGFFWTLWGIVQSFNPDTASAIAFFCVAGLAGLSMIATLVFGLYGTVGGTVYYVAKTAHATRLEVRHVACRSYLRFLLAGPVSAADAASLFAVQGGGAARQRQHIGGGQARGFGGQPGFGGGGLGQRQQYGGRRPHYQ